MEYTLNLQFINDGFAAISALYDEFGTEAKAALIVEWFCDEDGTFEELYRGALNFTKVTFSEGTICIAQIGLEKEGCQMIFNNSYDQKVNLDSLKSFDGTTSLTPYTYLGETIQLPNKTILKNDYFARNNSNVANVGYEELTDILIKFDFWKIGWDNPILAEFGTIDDTFLQETFDTDIFTTIPPLIIIDETGDYSVDLAISFILEFGLHADQIPTTNQYVVNIYLGYTPNGSTTVTSTLIYGSAPITPTVYALDSFGPCSYPTFDTVNFYNKIYTNPSYHLSQGDELRVYVEIGSTFQMPMVGTIDLCKKVRMPIDSPTIKNYFKAQLLSSFPATPSKIYLVNESLSRCAEALTNDCLRVFSTYFGRPDSQPYTSGAGDGCGSLECITKGLIIRNIPIQKDATGNSLPQITVSFKEIFDGFNAIHNIGLGIEADTHRGGNHKLLRIEPVEYFFNDTLILSLDKIADVKINVVPEGYFNKFQFGYQKWEAEQFSGLDEFATQRNYRNNITSSSALLSQLSTLIASGYAIEITRRQQYSTDSTKDWRYDNDTFIICLKRAAMGFKVEQNNITSPYNLVDPPTVYNFRISPVRNMLRWMKTIMQSYHDATAAASQLLFGSGTGNYSAAGMVDNGGAAECTLEGGQIGESATLSINSLDNPGNGIPIYYNETIEFDYPLSFADYKLIMANPNGTINIRWGQRADFVPCFISEIAYRPDAGDATYKLFPKVQYECATGIGCMIINSSFIVG